MSLQINSKNQVRFGCNLGVPCEGVRQITTKLIKHGLTPAEAFKCADTYIKNLTDLAAVEGKAMSHNMAIAYLKNYIDRYGDTIAKSINK